MENLHARHIENLATFTLFGRNVSVSGEDYNELAHELISSAAEIFAYRDEQMSAPSVLNKGR